MQKNHSFPEKFQYSLTISVWIKPVLCRAAPVNTSPGKEDILHPIALPLQSFTAVIATNPLRSLLWSLKIQSVITRAMRCHWSFHCNWGVKMTRSLCSLYYSQTNSYLLESGLICPLGLLRGTTRERIQILLILELPIVHRYLHYDSCDVQTDWFHWYMSIVCYGILDIWQLLQ